MSGLARSASSQPGSAVAGVIAWTFTVGRSKIERRRKLVPPHAGQRGRFSETAAAATA